MKKIKIIYGNIEIVTDGENNIITKKRNGSNNVNIKNNGGNNIVTIGGGCNIISGGSTIIKNSTISNGGADISNDSADIDITIDDDCNVVVNKNKKTCRICKKETCQPEKDICYKCFREYHSKFDK